jgi:membrane protein YdbS with pleckstrin-like domain
MALPRVTLLKLISALTVVILLFAAAFGIFIWAATSDWEDVAATATAIVFVIFSVFQGIFTYVWYKGSRHEEVYAVGRVKEEGAASELEESIPINRLPIEEKIGEDVA